MSPLLALLSLICFYYLGSGWSVPVELIVGTETGISYSTEKSHSPTLLADFNQVFTFRLTMIITVISYVCMLLHWCMLRCMSICRSYYSLPCVLLCHGKNNEAFRWYILCIANFQCFSILLIFQNYLYFYPIHQPLAKHWLYTFVLHHLLTIFPSMNAYYTRHVITDWIYWHQ